MAFRDMMQRAVGRVRNAWTPQSQSQVGSSFFTPGGTGQGSALGFGSEAPAAGMDQGASVNDWMRGIPEVQARMRRAQALRGVADQGQEAAATQATGSYMPTTHGGLFETAQRWNPDYAGMAKQAVGGLQGYFGGKMAEGEQQGYDTARTNMLLRGGQQFGGGLRNNPNMPMPGDVNTGMANRGANMMRWFQP